MHNVCATRCYLYSSRVTWAPRFREKPFVFSGTSAAASNVTKQAFALRRVTSKVSLFETTISCNDFNFTWSIVLINACWLYHSRSSFWILNCKFDITNHQKIIYLKLVLEHVKRLYWSNRLFCWITFCVPCY